MEGDAIASWGIAPSLSPPHSYGTDRRAEEDRSGQTVRRSRAPVSDEG